MIDVQLLVQQLGVLEMDPGVTAWVATTAMLFWAIQGVPAPTDPAFYAGWEKVGIVGVLIFVIFLLIGSWGLFLKAFLSASPRFVTVGRFDEMKHNYETILVQKTTEIAELTRENRDQNRDVVRLADDFRGVVRDVISAGIKDVTGG